VGHSSDAHCYACGYDTWLRLGAGMSNHAIYAAWPVSCKACSAVTTANFKKTPLTCERCQSPDVLPFTDPSLWKGDGNERDRWGDLALADGHYRCPKCLAFELRFGTNAGLHDLMSFD
jgi:hypothetical protein